MENYLTQITNYLLTQSWQIAVLVVLIAAVNLALKNKSAHIRYLLWLIVLAKCLVPPLVTIPLAILPQDKTPEPTLISNVEMPAANVELADMVTSEPIALPSLPVTSPTIMERLARVTTRQWLGFGWIVGVAAFLLFALIKALHTDQWLWRQRKPLPAEAQTRIEDLFFGLGLKTFPKVWLLSGIGQPFVWGLLRGNIYLPADFVKVNSAEHRKGVLGHELSHILRFDAAVNILQIIAQAIFWFHPFVWWANKKIRAEREKCCDEMAIASIGAKAKEYCNSIVNILIAEHESTRLVPSLAVAGPVKNIEERIKTMMRPGKKFHKRPSLIAATVVLLLALLTVPTVLVLTARAGTEAEETIGGRVIDEKGDDIHVKTEGIVQRFITAVRNMPEVFAIEAKTQYLMKSSTGKEKKQLTDIKYYRDRRCVDIESSVHNYPLVNGKTEEIPDVPYYQRSMIDRKNRAFIYNSKRKDRVPQMVVFWSDGEKVSNRISSKIGLGRVLEGYVAYDNRNLVELLSDKTSSMHYKGLEDIDGSKCHVLEVTIQNYGSYTLWLDPQYHHLPRKVFVTKKGKDIYGGTPVSDLKLAHGQLAEVSYVMDSVKFKHFDGVLLPVACKTTLIWKYTSGETAEWHGEHERLSIDLKPDFEALNAFEPNIPDGTRINHQDFVGKNIRFEWRNGKVVPVDVKPLSLMGKSLPELKDFGIDLSSDEANDKVTCTGKVVDTQGRPIAGAKVTAYEMRSDGIAGNMLLNQTGEVTTAEDGAFIFTMPKRERGIFVECYIVAIKQDLSLGWIVWTMREDTESNIQLGEPEKLEGVIVDEAGNPVAGAEVRANLFRTLEAREGEEKSEWLPGIPPFRELITQTNRQGRFLFSNLPADLEVDLLVKAEGKATIFTWRAESEKPAFKAGQTDIRVVLPDEARIEGQIVDPDTGRGIARVKFAVVFTGSGVYFYRFVCTTDDNGEFSIGGLQNSEYLIRGRRGDPLPWTYVNAKSGQTKKVKIGANKIYYGRIVFEDGSPVVITPEPWPGAKTKIYLVEEGKTSRGSIVDIDKEGLLKLPLSQEQYQQLQSGKAWFEVLIPYTNKKAYHGEDVFAYDLLATDKAKAGVVRIPRPKREPESVVGKLLFELKAFNIDLSQTSTQNRIILACFFDMQQRPSRYFLRELARRAQQLEQKGVTVVAIQASKIDENALNKWVKNDDISFAVGMVRGDAEKNKFAWGIRALPWLILADRNRVISAEGFGLGELYEKIEAVAEK